MPRGLVRLLGLLLLVPAPLSAQTVRIGRIGGAVELGAEAAFQDVRSDAGTRSFDRLRTDEKIELDVDGSILSPRFIGFRLGGSLGLRQERFRGTDVPGIDADSTLIGYDALLSILPLAPVSLLLVGTRADDETLQSLGTDTRARSELLGATLHLRLPVLPLQLLWQRQQSRVESLGGLFRSIRDETRDRIELSGQHNGFQLDGGFRLRREQVTDDSIPTAGGDFDVEEGTGRLRYRWGEYLEKSLRTRASVLRRTGRAELGAAGDFLSASATAGFFWEPTLDLDLRSQYDFDLFDSDTQRSRLHSLLLGLEHRLYESLRSRVDLRAEHEDLDVGRRRSLEPRLSFAYRKRLPLDSRLLLDLGGSYRLRDTELGVRELRVSGESLTLTEETGNFLARPRVIAGTVEVRRSPTDPLLLEGIDYELRTVGDRTSVEILVGGVLSPGDTVVVDYRYQVDPSARIARLAIQAGAALEHPWVALRYRHSEADERLLAGDPTTLLEDTRQDSYRLELRRQGPRLRALAAVQLSRDRTTTVSYDELALLTTGGLRLTRDLDLTWSAQRRTQTFLGQDREVEVLGGALSASWRPRPRWLLRTFARFRDLADTSSVDQRDLETGIRVQLRFGRIEVLPTVTWLQRERGSARSRDLRVLLRLRRSF